MKKIKNYCSVSVVQKLSIAMATVILFLSSGIAYAQHAFNLTFRPAANFPVKDLGETRLNAGGGFETTLSYRFLSHIDIYAGWGWNMFSQKESAAGLKNEFNETGYKFGFHFIHPLSAESKLNFMIGGGGIYNHIETENEEGDIINDTGHGLGWECDAGLWIPVGHHNRWHLIPSVMYHELSRDINMEEINTTVDLNYFSIGLGVSWTLWSAAE